MSVLQIVSVILLVLVIWSVEGHILEKSQTDEKKDCGVCEKKECVDTAARILDSLDPQTKPCDDFYQFACGGWVKQQVIPPHRVEAMTYYDTDKEMAFVKGLLAADVLESDLEAVKKAKNLYASCVEFGSRSKNQKNKDMDNFVKGKLGAPSLAAVDWQLENFDLQNFLVKAARLYVFPVFRIGVSTDIKDQDGKLIFYHVLAVQEPELSLPTSVYNVGGDNLAETLLFKKIYAKAKRLGSIGDEQIAQDAAEIVVVERTLAQIINKTASFKGQVSRLTLADIDEKINSDKFNFTKFVTDLFSDPEVGVTDISTEQSATIVNPYYFFNATSYFFNLQPRTQSNFLTWRVMDTFYNSILLKTKKEKVKNLLDESVFGDIAKVPLEESCVEYVSKAFGLVLHRLLYDNKFPPDEMKEVFKILMQVQREFDVVVHEHHWVDEKSRKSILDKNAALGTTFMYYKQAMNDSLLDLIYTNMTVDRDDFINNVWYDKREQVVKNYRLLRQPYQRKLQELPHEFVAQNNHIGNIMEYTSVIFEPPFYIRNVPSAINYGGLGMTVGHEIVHAFDDKGYLKNKEARYGNWWSNETVAVFQEKSQCLVQQYNNFYYETAGLNVNGKLTLTENMGDQGGIKLAFRAYQKYGKSLETRDQALPGVDFTNDQLFFVNFAQCWCRLQSRESAVSQVQNSPHSPNPFRVNGGVQNSPDFARVFNCPVGSKMNPETKCEVW